MLLNSSLELTVTRISNKKKLIFFIIFMLIFHVTLLLDNMLLLVMSKNYMTFPHYLYSYLFSLQYYPLFSQESPLCFFN